MTPTGIIKQTPRKEGFPPVSRNPGRPSRNASEAIRAHILDAAERLFLSQGFEATSLNQLAAAAGATKRTLYVKVGDKNEIFAATVRRLLGERRGKLDDVPTAGPILSRLILFGEHLLQIALDPKVIQLNRLLVAEAPRFPELAVMMQDQIEHGSREKLAVFLRREVAEGHVALENPTTAAALLLTMFIGEAQRVVLFGLPAWDAGQRKAWAQEAATLFYNSCKSR